MQQAAVPKSKAPHAGEDVSVYTHGTMAHLFHGVYEQPYIAHAAAFAACIGEYTDYSSDHCTVNSATGQTVTWTLVTLSHVAFRVLNV